MIKNKSRYLTSHQAAIQLGFTPDYIRRMIAQGRIHAEKLGTSWLIDIRQLRKIKRQRFSREKDSENGSNK